MSVIELKRSIVLVGLMGAGKTSVGRRLAEMLDVRFIDSDDEVVAAAHMTIPEIFETYGEPEFRRLERAVISRLLASGPLVLSTGGGAFIQDEVRAMVRASAVSVWLSAEVDVLFARVGDKPGRPLLAAADPRGMLAALAERRNPVYALADVTVTSDGRDTQDGVARAVIRALAALDKEAQGEPVFSRSEAT